MNQVYIDHIISSISANHSKEMANTLLQWINHDQEKFDSLVTIVAGDYPQKIKDRAAWVMSDAIANNSSFLVGNWEILVGLLMDKKTSHPIKRNLVRFMQFGKIPEHLRGMVTHRCLELINHPKEDIAIRAFSITIVYNMVKLYPELKPELYQSLLELMPDASPGLKNRARKTLEKLDKD